MKILSNNFANPMLKTLKNNDINNLSKTEQNMPKPILFTGSGIGRKAALGLAALVLTGNVTIPAYAANIQGGNNVSNGISEGLETKETSSQGLRAYGFEDVADICQGEINADALQADADKADAIVWDTGKIWYLLENYGIPSEGLEFNINRNKMNLNILDDIDKLFLADNNNSAVSLKPSKYSENTAIQDVFVPKYENENEALQKLNIGDVCRINGSERVSIKESDDSIKELKLSVGKYLELFPPVSRFAIRQGSVNDCFLVAVLDALINSPKGRIQIFECFTELKDGSVAVTFPRGRLAFRLENGAGTEDCLKLGDEGLLLHFLGQDTQIDESKEAYARACEGLKALEHLFGIEKYIRQFNVTAESAVNLQNALEQENQDLGEIAKWHYYYGVDYKDALEDTMSAVISRNGGVPSDTRNCFNITSVINENGSTGLANTGVLDELFGTPKLWENHIIFAGWNIGRQNENAQIKRNHQYIIEPYIPKEVSEEVARLEAEGDFKGVANLCRYKIINPLHTSVYNFDFSYNEVNQEFSDIEAFGIN